GWNALLDVVMALLDRRVRAEPWALPEIGVALVDRIAALLRVLAERWGRVIPEGVLVPLALSHRLIGARRPTVSTAVAGLARRGRLQRRADGTWLLVGESVSESALAPDGVVRQRRRLMQRPDTGTDPATAATSR